METPPRPAPDGGAEGHVNNDDDSDFYNTSPPRLADAARGTPSKRKRDSATPESRNKRRTGVEARPAPQLTPEIWQRVFCLLPTTALLQLERVNRAFRCYLTTAITQPNETETGVARPLQPNDIWMSARLLHHPSLPHPLVHMAEADFWHLLLRRTCEFCGRLPDTATRADDMWAGGPGPQGVRIVWQFGIRSCGACLGERVQTEVSLLYGGQSAFLQVLPFTFMTSSSHLVSPSAIQSGRPIPPQLELLKYFYKPHVEMAQKLLEEAQQNGNTMDYVNKLQTIKDQRMASAAEWEETEQSHFISRLPTPVPRSLLSTPAATAASRSAATSPAVPSTPGRPTSAKASGAVSSYGSTHRHSNSTSRNGGRNPSFAVEGKAARRADIERRCLTLNPPISASLLPHLESFQAAIQISSPLTDDAWDLLRPRLEAQREAAEQRENTNAESEERKKQGAVIKEAKEEVDRQWEESQAPLRQRLAGYADDFIRDYWANGQSVTVELMPKFAADLLIGVRSRFVSDQARESSGQAPPAAAASSSTANVPLPRKLVLDNMRWIYDNKVKPLTEARKELFLCNGCDAPKLYAFDGVIQHYAAKHTEAFSIGNIVVHWQSAEWPETPPFAPDPDAKRRQNLQDAVFQVPNMPNYSVPMHAPQPGSFGGFPAGMSPGPYGNPAYGQQYHPGGPYQPPGHYMAAERAQHNFSPSFGPSRVAGGGGAGFQNFAGLQSASPFNNRSAFYGPGVAATPVPSGPAWPPPMHPHGYGAGATGAGAAAAAAAAAPSNLYYTQLEEVANVAREIWGLVSNVRALPQSVRMTCVISSVVHRFQQRFSNEPSLDLFTDCLINHSLMRPLKDADGLACKVCVEKNESRDGSDSPSFPLSSGERKLYPFHSLLVHFKNAHIEHAMHGQHEYRLDWKQDMIELPSHDFISRLSRAQGVDHSKLALLAAVFPDVTWATEGHAMSRDPVMGLIATNHSPIGSGLRGPAGRLSAASQHTRGSGVQSRVDDSRLPHPPSVHSASARSPDADHEYDPRRPNFADDRPEGQHASQEQQTGGAPETLSTSRRSQSGSQLRGARRTIESGEGEGDQTAKGDRASQFLADFGQELQQQSSKSARAADSVSRTSGRDRSPHSQPTDETLAALREQGFIIIPPEAPEHYERQQSMPLRRQRQSNPRPPAPPRYQQYPRSAYRSAGYHSRYREERRAMLPRSGYPRYAYYPDDYDDYHDRDAHDYDHHEHHHRQRLHRPPPPSPSHTRYGPMPPELEHEPYEVMYMRRQDIPRYYEPVEHHYDDEDDRRRMRHESERFSRPPAATNYDDEAGGGGEDTRAGPREDGAATTTAGSRAASRAL